MQTYDFQLGTDLNFTFRTSEQKKTIFGRFSSSNPETSYFGVFSRNYGVLRSFRNFGVISNLGNRGDVFLQFEPIMDDVGSGDQKCDKEQVGAILGV